MPEQTSIFINNVSYSDTTYEPPFIFVGDVSTIKLTVFNSVDCEYGFRWAVDNLFEVISTDTYPLVGGNEESTMVPITARWVQPFVINIASNPCNLKFQFFFLNNFPGTSILSNTGSGVPLFNAPGGIKSLTSNDNSVIITDNITEVDLSVPAVNTGLVTVGTVDADYPTLYDAINAMNCNIRVITDVIETQQINMNLTCPHLRIEVSQGVSISNTISADWFIGDNTLLYIQGAGYSSDFVAGNVSSQIILENNQTFRSGTNAELDIHNMRITGAGTNILLGGSSTVNNCRFDGSTLINLNTYEQNLTVSDCLFVSPSNLNSTTGASVRSLFITNNVFSDNADITMDGADGMIFSDNTIGKTVNTNLVINGICNNVSILDNIFHAGNITINSTTFTNSILSNNTANNITINSIISDCNIGTNNCNNLIFINAIDNASINSNTIDNDMNIGGNVINSTISDNKMRDMVCSQQIGNNGNPVGITSNTMRRDFIIDGRVRSTNFVGNTILRHCLINERIGSAGGPVLIGSNIVDGNFIVQGNVLEATINNNNFGSVQFVGTYIRSVFSGNLLFLTGDITFDSNVVGCVLNANRADNITFGGIVGTDNAPVEFQNNGCRANVLFQGATTAILCSTNYIRGNLTFSSTVGSNNNRVNISSNSISTLTITGNAINTTINGNNVDTLTTNGDMDGCIINSNIIGDSASVGTFTTNGTITNTTISSNQLRIFTSNGPLMDYTTFSSNVLDINAVDADSVIIAGTCTSCSIIGNSSTGKFIFNGPLQESIISINTLLNIEFYADITDTQLTSNNITSTTLNPTLLINGNCDRVNITSNKGFNNWNLNGNFSNSTLNNNVIPQNTGIGSMIFNGLVDNCAVNGNSFDGSIDVILALTNSTVSNNTIRRLSTNDLVRDTDIIGNNFKAVATPNLTIGGQCLRCVISSNHGSHDWNINGALTSSSFSNNVISSGSPPGTGNLTIVGVITSSIINNNSIVLDATIQSSMTTSKFSNNIVGGVAVIDSLITGNSTDNTISDNTLFSTLVINATVGIVSNILNTNIVSTSITATSNNINNIITSNRCPLIVGFGGTDSIANNI